MAGFWYLWFDAKNEHLKKGNKILNTKFKKGRISFLRLPWIQKNCDFKRRFFFLQYSARIFFFLILLSGQAKIQSRKVLKYNLKQVNFLQRNFNTTISRIYRSRIWIFATLNHEAIIQKNFYSSENFADSFFFINYCWPLFRTLFKSQKAKTSKHCRNEIKTKILEFCAAIDKII